jgi:GLPGLI family protein
LIFFIIVSKVLSQEKISVKTQYKAIYNLNFQKDSTDITTKFDEKMVLLIGNNYSIFESYSNKYNDSLKKAIFKKGLSASESVNLVMSNRKKNRFNFRILKSKTETLTYDSYFNDKLIYEDEEKLNWKITNKTKIVSGYNCTLAQTSFAGRQYNAWFTNEIPISDGQYKFKGLPGLIISITDSRNHYNFELISFQKDITNFTFDKSKGIRVTKKEYFKAYNPFKKNFIAQLENRGIEIQSSNSRNLKQRVQKSRNNVIEIKY